MRSITLAKFVGHVLGRAFRSTMVFSVIRILIKLDDQISMYSSWFPSLLASCSQ